MSAETFNLSDVRYCVTHDAHWLPPVGATDKGASCPWCQRDVFYDELENIHDVFLTAVCARESKGGQQVPYFGDFGSAPPSTINQMRQWIKRWDALLGKNVRRGI